MRGAGGPSGPLCCCTRQPPHGGSGCDPGQDPVSGRLQLTAARCGLSLRAIPLKKRILPRDSRRRGLHRNQADDRTNWIDERSSDDDGCDDTSVRPFPVCNPSSVACQ
jgi:hypothetical protein